MQRLINDTQVLIVDDTPAMRLIVQTILTAVGFPKPHQANDGAEAFGVLIDKRVDLLITDFAMDRLDGLDLVHAVRKHPNPRIAAMPVVLLTGHVNVATVRAAAAAGVDRVLAKPVTPNALLEHVEAALAKRAKGGSGSLVSARIA